MAAEVASPPAHGPGLAGCRSKGRQTTTSNQTRRSEQPSGLGSSQRQRRLPPPLASPTSSRPGMFNMRERAKWDAWEAVKDKSKEAMNDYTTKVKQLQEEAAAAGSYSQRRTLCAILL
ncbi:hypothetical protein CFC21_102937 [Triticum aestivum]|uniref:ACB domain-containing protein n=2 Tax=Triticum aestivum TaxID=4565 RepID=A0A9R1M768_WHEAT|nr:hypothetical protein CFC21_102937 [Triticum aestivum]